ncbi:hypothetical protein IW261DRAFT_1677831 [Armillaria novae-zelandiae]|uniref:Telomeric single stranded DNA binding POT1/Cdc13 domain-containing protein n=1 Tax=Armillaria novae-zelandiae TaxID=153914 RepID=A0AA39PDE8_9AGAR|nr:hypothetical protein IW261DRAFT_1677831 [Armillaria novae-zelandiae]
MSFDHLSLKRFAADLLSNPDNDSGYVSGTISMVWNRTDRCRFIFKIDASNDAKSSVPFDVIFAAVSAQGLKLCPTDKLDLGLKGISWKVAMNSGRFFDTGLPRRPMSAHKDENRYWRSTKDSQVDVSTPRWTPTLIRHDAPIHFPQRKRSHAVAILADTPVLIFSALGMSSSDSIPPALQDSRFSMTARLNFSRTQYVALKETSMMAHGKLINVIGIVKFVSEPFLVSHGEHLTCTIKILDPSISSLEDRACNEALGVTVLRGSINIGFLALR